MALSTTFTQWALETTKFGKTTQNKGHFSVQGHWRSPILALIESSYTTSYQWLLLTYLLSCTVFDLHSLRNVKNCYIWPPLLRLNPPAEGFPWNDLRKIFSKCQWMAKVPNGEETLPKISTGWVGCTNATDRRQTDDRRNVSSRSLKTWLSWCNYRICHPYSKEITRPTWMMYVLHKRKHVKHEYF